MWIGGTSQRAQRDISARDGVQWEEYEFLTKEGVWGRVQIPCHGGSVGKSAGRELRVGKGETSQREGTGWCHWFRVQGLGETAGVGGGGGAMPLCHASAFDPRPWATAPSGDGRNAPQEGEKGGRGNGVHEWQ